MVVRYIDVETLKHETPMLAVGVFEGTETLAGWLEIIDRALGGAILRVLSSGDFRGKSREELVLYGPENTGSNGCFYSAWASLTNWIQNLCEGLRVVLFGLQNG